jgi:hypothetical protein
MNPIDIFLSLLRQALIRVDNHYYGMNYWNNSMLNYYGVEENSPERQILKNYLDRYGERVFCYELYHQLRVLMSEDQHNLDFENVVLQAELKKENIGEIAHVFEAIGIQALDSEYIPDFLLHSPGDFDRQYLITEVKSNPQLTFSGIKDDLLKIQQFITRYSYQRGVFLTINTNPTRIINSLKDLENREWISNNIKNPELIHFMCKKKNDVDLFECTLNNLPELD